MLKILPIQDKAEQELDCNRCGIPFREELLAYAASVDDIFIGMCQFRVTDHGGEIYDLCTVPGKTDFEALIIMGRTALNFIDLCGVHFASFVSENPDVALMRAIGLEKNEKGFYSADLTDFFLHPCKNHKCSGQNV